MIFRRLYKIPFKVGSPGVRDAPQNIAAIQYIQDTLVASETPTDKTAVLTLVKRPWPLYFCTYARAGWYAVAVELSAAKTSREPARPAATKARPRASGRSPGRDRSGKTEAVVQRRTASSVYSAGTRTDTLISLGRDRLDRNAVLATGGTSSPRCPAC